MPEYSKKKLVKACEILKMISENQVGTTTQTKKKQRPNWGIPLKAGLCFLHDQKIRTLRRSDFWYSSIHLEIPDHFFQSGAEWY